MPEVEAPNNASLPDDTAIAGSRTPKKEDHQPGTLGEAFAKSRFDPGLCDAICAALGGDQDTETDILASMPPSEIEGLVNELVLETGLPLQAAEGEGVPFVLFVQAEG